MIHRYTHRSITWADCENPTQEDIRTLADTYNIDPLIAAELAVPSTRSKAERFGDHIYVILHFPTIKHDQGASEIDFVIGKELLVTTRYHQTDAFLEFRKVFEVDSLLDRNRIGEHGGILFYHMMHGLYHGLADELDVLSSAVQEIENNIFKGKEKEMVLEISTTNRKVLHYAASLRHHKPVLDSFREFAIKMFGENFAHYADIISSEYEKAAATIVHLQAYISEIRETNNSMLTTKQNEIMKSLTAMAFNTMPLALVASIFGMNAIHMPIVQDENGFWFLIGGMSLLALAMFLFLKKKKWL
jgi:magnesium transporter